LVVQSLAKWNVKDNVEIVRNSLFAVANSSERKTIAKAYINTSVSKTMVDILKTYNRGKLRGIFLRILILS